MNRPDSPAHPWTRRETAQPVTGDRPAGKRPAGKRITALGPAGLRLSAALAAPVAALVTAAGLTGCGDPAAVAPPPPVTATATAGQDGVQRITITGDDALQFTPSTVIAHRGRLVITFKDVGTEPHTLGFDALGARARTGNVNARASTTLTLDLTRTGSFVFDCDYHPIMEGRLVVS